VVIARSSGAKFEPFDSATTFFTLNEGEVVSEVASREGWIKIKRIDGKQGWIKRSAVEFL
jgi:SH3-like domain-containing protein